jgi:hypothetical protein
MALASFFPAFAPRFGGDLGNDVARPDIGLFITHPLIDRFLEVQGHKVHHFAQFEQMHTVYLVCATVQWSAAMLQIWLMLMAWLVQDRISPQTLQIQSDHASAAAV